MLPLITNAVKLADIAIHLVLQEVRHLTQEVRLDIMNADKLAKVALLLVLTEPRPRIQVVAAGQPETNVVRKLVIILMRDVVLTPALRVLPRLIVNPAIMLNK